MNFKKLLREAKNFKWTRQTMNGSATSSCEFIESTRDGFKFKLEDQPFIKNMTMKREEVESIENGVIKTNFNQQFNCSN